MRISFGLSTLSHTLPLSCPGEAPGTAETLRKGAPPGAADKEVDEDDKEGED